MIALLVALANVVPFRRRPSEGEVWRSHNSLRGGHQLPRGESAASADACPGLLRWVDVGGPVLFAECDRCGYETGVRWRDL